MYVINCLFLCVDVCCHGNWLLSWLLSGHCECVPTLDGHLQVDGVLLSYGQSRLAHRPRSHAGMSGQSLGLMQVCRVKASVSCRYVGSKPHSHAGMSGQSLVLMQVGRVKASVSCR